MKYDLRKAESEVKFNDRKMVGEGITQTYKDDIFEKVLESFDSKEKALEALKNYESTCKWYNENKPNFRITEYYVVEVGEDKWGEDEDMGILEFAPLDLTRFYENYR